LPGNFVVYFNLILIVISFLLFLNLCLTPSLAAVTFGAKFLQ
jgi:hypothetical protein